MPQSPVPDYYELFGVPRDADVDTITKAYRRLTRVVHPDTGGTPGMFRLVRAVYETLSDPDRRRAYDAALDGRAEWPDWPPDDQAEEPVYDTGAGWQGPGSEDFAAESGSVHDTSGRTAWAFEPGALSWWSEAEPGRPPVYVPASAGTGYPVVAMILAFASPAWLVKDATVAGLLFLFLGLAVTVVAFFKGGDRRGGLWVSLGFVATGATGAVAGYFGAGSLPALPLVVALAGLFVSVMLAYRGGVRQQLISDVPPSMVEEREYGRAGVGCGDVDDNRADELAGIALSTLRAIPGVRVFYGLRPYGWSGPSYHAVACGRSVALVAVRIWEPGRYEWALNGSLLRDGRPFDGDRVGIGDDVSACQGLLGLLTDVRGFVLVVPTREGELPEATAKNGTLLGDAQTVVDRIGKWFLAQGATDVVYRRVIDRLYDQLPEEDEADEE